MKRRNRRKRLLAAAGKRQSKLSGMLRVDDDTEQQLCDEPSQAPAADGPLAGQAEPAAPPGGRDICPKKSIFLDDLLSRRGQPLRPLRWPKSVRPSRREVA